MRTVAFLSDFGNQDGYPAIIQGVIKKLSPRTEFITITNEIQPFNITSAILILRRCLGFFPKTTIFLAVVDPGVGTTRRSIVAAIGPYFFVGPDNGLITPLIEVSRKSGWKNEIFQLDQPRYWLADLSSTFHGRDVFAPVAAYIARGIALQKLGTPIDDVMIHEFPVPNTYPDKIIGKVLYIDHFGNLVSNIAMDLIDVKKVRKISYKNLQISQIKDNFGETDGGQPLAYRDSDGSLAIAIAKGNAAEIFHANVGDKLEIIFQDEE